jgi:hypothetical protein
MGCELVFPVGVVGITLRSGDDQTGVNLANGFPPHSVGSLFPHTPRVNLPEPFIVGAVGASGVRDRQVRGNEGGENFRLSEWL